MFTVYVVCVKVIVIIRSVVNVYFDITHMKSSVQQKSTVEQKLHYVFLI